MFKGRILLRTLGTANRYLCTQNSRDSHVVKLHNRSVIRLAGEESRDFVQGLITNDIQHLGGSGSSIYSQFLNKAGRVLYDVIIYGMENKAEILIEADNSIGPELRKHMMIYRIRRKISIDLVDDDYSVWAAYGGELGEGSELPDSCSDPRVKEMGRRILTQLPDDAIAGQLNVGSLRDYNRHRYRWGVAEGVKEITPGKAFPLEANCDYMHGLSVHKGCYLGQEFTARTYHTGVVRKRIMPIEVEAGAVEEDLVDKEVVTAEEKQGGKVKAIEGRVGIGLLRVDMVLATQQLRINKTVPVKTWKPDWWPIVAPKAA